MYRYKIDSSFDRIPLEINIIKVPLNNKGFADLLSINLEYTCKLNRAKNRINEYNSSVWEEVKKHTNPYEFIYAFNNKHKGNDYRSVSLYKPLSRSFFKMIEIIHEFYPCILNNDFKSSRKFYQKKKKKDKIFIFDDDSDMNSDMNNDMNSNINSDMNSDMNSNSYDELTKTSENAISKLISVHIAEGPGGFIEAVRFVRKGKYDDHAFGMTLIDNKYNITQIKDTRDNFLEKSYQNKRFNVGSASSTEAPSASSITIHIPGWKQSNNFLLHNPEVHIIYGADGTGNIYKPENINFLFNEMIKNSKDTNRKDTNSKNTNRKDTNYMINMDMNMDMDMNMEYLAHLITADGGFDFSVEYNYQEQSSIKLIFSQIIAAIKCQRINGTFICKFFDINLYFTAEMLYLLYTVYDKITIYKPFTSRIANSEKYIICNNFRGISKDLLDNLFNVLNEWNEYKSETINQIFKEIPIIFIDKIIEINKEIVDAQIYSINNAIDIIKKQKFITNSFNYSSNLTVEKQIKYAKDWCNRYNIPYKH